MSSKEFVHRLAEMNTDYCAGCGKEHSYMSGPCEKCGSSTFTKEEPSLYPTMYGVYKFYKHGDCNNSPYVAIFEDENDAKEAVEVLERLRLHGQKDKIFACNEGWEFGSYWTYGKVPKPMTFEEFTTHIDEVMSRTEYKPEEGE